MSLRLEMLSRAHEENDYPCVNKIIKLITLQLYWSRISQYINNYVEHSHIYKISKKERQKSFGSAQGIFPTEKPLEYPSLDNIGGFNYYNSIKKHTYI